MQNTITLIKANGMWAAKYSGPHARQLVQLFGTDVLPTPFEDSTASYMVFNVVKGKNMDCVVEVQSASGTGGRS